jgi:site-specific recombinase XerD
VLRAGERTSWRFVDFFTSTIRNPNTREAYYRAVTRFLAWCEGQGIVDLHTIRPIHVAAYVEQLDLARPSVKQHLAAIRKCFNWLLAGGVLDLNPAGPVQGPRHVVRTGKTPVLDATQTRELLDSILLDHVVGLRDRALIAVMVFTFGRVGAVTAMDVEDFFISGRRRMFRLHEKGGKEHAVPAHHNAIECVEDYLDGADLWGNTKAPLFQSLDRHRRLSGRRLQRQDVFRMLKRRARDAGLPETTCCHTFRATGITNYLQNGGSLEHARALASHESSQTTRLYDHSGDKLSLDEIERIRI